MEWLLREEAQKTGLLVLVPSQQGAQMLQTRKVQREHRAQVGEHCPWRVWVHASVCMHAHTQVYVESLRRFLRLQLVLV